MLNLIVLLPIAYMLLWWFFTGKKPSIYFVVTFVVLIAVCVSLLILQPFGQITSAIIALVVFVSSVPFSAVIAVAVAPKAEDVPIQKVEEAYNKLDANQKSKLHRFLQGFAKISLRWGSYELKQKGKTGAATAARQASKLF